MNTVLTIIQIILSIAITCVTLLQPKGTGLGSGWGGSGEFYHTRRGMEKILFIITILLVIAFFAISIVNFLAY